MADDAESGALDEGTENAALREALAAEHAAVWGYGVVGAALAVEARPPATAAETAHRDVRDQVTALLEERARRPGRSPRVPTACRSPCCRRSTPPHWPSSSRTASPRRGCACWTRRPSGRSASWPSGG